MVNISILHKQQRDEELTRKVVSTKRSAIRWLGRSYKSLYDLCQSKGIPYTTVKSRLGNGLTLNQAILNCDEYNLKNNVMRLWASGAFTMSEIAMALDVSPRKVEYIINSQNDR